MARFTDALNDEVIPKLENQMNDVFTQEEVDYWWQEIIDVLKQVDDKHFHLGWVTKPVPTRILKCDACDPQIGKEMVCNSLACACGHYAVSEQGTIRGVYLMPQVIPQAFLHAGEEEIVAGHFGIRRPLADKMERTIQEKSNAKFVADDMGFLLFCTFFEAFGYPAVKCWSNDMQDWGDFYPRARQEAEDDPDGNRNISPTLSEVIETMENPYLWTR